MHNNLCIVVRFSWRFTFHAFKWNYHSIIFLLLLCVYRQFISLLFYFPGSTGFPCSKCIFLVVLPQFPFLTVSLTSTYSCYLHSPCCSGLLLWTFSMAAIAALCDTALLTTLAAPQSYLALLLEIKFVCPVKELSSAESGNMGKCGAELLEFNKSQQKTGCSRNMMSKGRDTLRAAGCRRWGWKHEVKLENREKSKGRGIEDKMRNGAMRVSFSVTLFHMVEPLFKRPITL